MKIPIKHMCLAILIIIIGVLPLQVFAATTTEAASSPPHSHYYECKVNGEGNPAIYKGTKADGSDSKLFQAIKLALPANTKALNNKGVGFNFSIWHDKGIVVYGTYKNFSEGINQFKAGSNVAGVEPYYMENSVKGEYRYHGYDSLGNRSTNMNFKDDVNSDEALIKRRWVFQPWEDQKVKEAPKTGYIQPSDYNKEAMDKPNGFFDIWIRDGINVFKSGGVHTGVTGAGEHKSESAMANYVNILSAPTPRFEGSGRMWRLSEDNRILYQTFTVNKYTKIEPPVDGTITVINSKDFANIIDKTKEDAEWSKQIIKARVSVVAHLKDEPYLTSDLLKAKYYHRLDIVPSTGWAVTLNSGVAGVSPTLISKTASANITTWTYEVPFSYGQVKAGALKNMSSTAKVTYVDGKYSSGIPVGVGNASFKEIPTPTPTITPPVTPTPEEPTGPPIPTPPPELINIDVDINRPLFDIVPVNATDSTTITGGEIIQKDVYINGEQVDYDSFFSGNYIFGIGQDGDKRIDVKYTTGTGRTFNASFWRYVYDTKPTAQFNMSGSYKQNRLMKVNNISPIGNVQLVLDAYPITSYQWSYRTESGDGTSRRIHDISDMYKELMYKTPGVYEVQLIATNTLGRVSDPYILKFEIYPDYAPAVNINLNDVAVARGEPIAAYNYGAVSTDNDAISTNIVELWYDSNNDGVYDQKLNTYDGKLGFPTFSATTLGNYKFVNTVTESFGEATMPEYITPADTVSKTVELEFIVDNYIPLTDIYIDIPIVRPVVDTFVLLDANLDNAKTEYIQAHRMDYNNYLRSENIIPTFNDWNMKTYTYSQPASTTSHTGTSEPPASIPYSSNGYSGTLTMTNRTNNWYDEDHGNYVPKSDSKEVEAPGQSTSGTNLSYDYPPSSVSYDSDGYTGTLSGYGYVYDSTDLPGGGYTWTRSYAGYKGTVTKNFQEWQPNIVTIDDYTGFYNGTIYKYVRQPFTNPFSSGSSYKYIIYVSDGTVSELADLQNVRGQSDAKLILIGSYAIQSQIAHDYFIFNDGRPIDVLMKDALNIITKNNPEVSKYTILAGQESFGLNAVTIDTENDPIIEQKFQYVQDLSYFDNNTGVNPQAVTTFSNTSGWTDTKLTTFSKVGKYSVYTRAKDRPSPNPNLASFSYYSGTPHIDIYAHRRPIALATLDWDFNASTGKYKTRWVDLGYDLDHNITLASTTRGIVDRKIKFRKDSGEWQYFIPSELAVGTYEVQYFVKDMEGAWSDPWYYNFTLSGTPTVQIKADLKAKDAKFVANSAAMGTTDLSSRGIPSTEWLEEFNLWTRYPHNVSLQSGFWNGSSFITPVRQITLNGGTGYKAGNDINWYNVDYQIVPRRTDNSYLYDGVYTFRISAVGDYGQTVNKDFFVRIQTPINLVPTMPAELIAKKTVSITATTTKYAETTQVVLFAGTPYATVQTMVGAQNGNIKNWTLTYNVPTSPPSGTYNAVFTATAVNGGTEVVTRPFVMIHNSPPTVRITGTIPGFVYESDNANAVIQSNDPDNDVLIAHLQLLQGSTELFSEDFSISPVGGVYNPITRLMRNDIEIGNYQIKVTVTDRYGETASDAYNFTVNPLGISGEVNHTTQWEQNRQNYNKAAADVGNAIRAYNIFFPGEEFVLHANTTAINPVSAVTANSVRVNIKGTSWTTILNKTSTNYFDGSLWDEVMIRWKDQTLDFMFEVTYSNGAIKTDIVRVYVDDDSYWRLHRLF